MRQLILGSLVAAGLTASAAAASPMDLSMLDRAVAEFTGAEVGQPGGAKLPVDRRLRLQACQSPLDLQWFGRDQRSVQVACPDMLLLLGPTPSQSSLCGQETTEVRDRWEHTT